MFTTVIEYILPRFATCALIAIGSDITQRNDGTESRDKSHILSSAKPSDVTERRVYVIGSCVYPRIFRHTTFSGQLLSDDGHCAELITGIAVTARYPASTTNGDPIRQEGRATDMTCLHHTLQHFPRRQTFGQTFVQKVTFAIDTEKPNITDQTTT